MDVLLQQCILIRAQRAAVLRSRGTGSMLRDIVAQQYLHSARKSIFPRYVRLRVDYAIHPTWQVAPTHIEKILSAKEKSCSPPAAAPAVSYDIGAAWYNSYPYGPLSSRSFCLRFLGLEVSRVAPHFVREGGSGGSAPGRKSAATSTPGTA